MDTRLLEAFLLATVQEPWHYWWDSTRLIFADFLEENGKDAEALALRTMEVVIADEIDTQGREVSGIEVQSSYRSFPPVLLSFALETWEAGCWVRNCSHDFNPNDGRAFRACFPPKTPRVRVFCFGDYPAEIEVGYELPVRGTHGHWRGMLSLDRARLRCRRRALEMFGRTPAPHMIPPDDSPRWVPNEAVLSPGLTLPDGRALMFPDGGPYIADPRRIIRFDVD